MKIIRMVVDDNITDKEMEALQSLYPNTKIEKEGNYKRLERMIEFQSSYIKYLEETFIGRVSEEGFWGGKKK